jgi:hypothetical protein
MVLKIQQAAYAGRCQIVTGILCGFIYCQHYLSVYAAIQKN